MKKEKRILDFKNLHKSLTDPEEREKAKRAAERIKRREDKKADTGL